MGRDRYGAAVAAPGFLPKDSIALLADSFKYDWGEKRCQKRQIGGRGIGWRCVKTLGTACCVGSMYMFFRA